MNDPKENFYDVEIQDVNKIFVINGRVIRSPFKTTIPAKDLEQFLCMVRANSVEKFSYDLTEVIIPIKKNKNQEIDEHTIVSLGNESITILDTIINKIERDKQ